MTYANRPSFKEQVGCWLHERWRAELIMLFPGLAARIDLEWLDLCNRHEELQVDTRTGARICQWRDSSSLTVSRMFPEVSRRLLKHALRRWPIQFDYSEGVVTSNQPDISVIIPIGGRERSAHLELVVAGLRAQSDVCFEIIVVEESRESELCENLPKDVIYKHIYSPLVEQKGFNKGWALNVGARLARAPLLLMLDADFLVPTGFLKECIRLSNGSVSVRPGRYIYYLDEISSLRLLSNGCLPDDLSVNLVVQNNPTPYLIPSSMYWDIGGHAESFFGWGGEDLEFLTRLRTKPLLEGGTLPVIHLWHQAAPKKANGDRNAVLIQAINQIDVMEQIRLLKTEQLGSDQPKVVTVSRAF